eukprot:EC716191.1.p1 GENE.EC716191.1~~EC716191.1.p1  ORF type:complete len:185 (+),score=13.74 EC716191.1:3-557(+)
MQMSRSALLSVSRTASSLSRVAIPRARYHERVIDHYEHPRNVGSKNRADPNVGTGVVGAPSCGDVMKLQIELDKEGKIVDAVFRTFGCGSAIASSSVVTEWIKGKHISDVYKIQNSSIAQYLSLPPVKLHCSILAEDAIQAAAADVIKKNPHFRQYVPDSHRHTLDRAAVNIPPSSAKSAPAAQ